jgi:hypothetical protein
MFHEMRIVLARILVLAVGISIGSSGAAAAQEASTTSDPTSAVHTGQTVWVTTADGRQLHGRIESVSVTGISVDTGQGVTPVRWTETRLIEAPDSVVDGVVKGALIGGLSGGVPAAVFMGSYGECPCSTSGSIVLRYAALGAGICAAIGAMGDSSRIGRRQLYKTSATVSIAPVVFPGRLAVSAAVRW